MSILKKAQIAYALYNVNSLLVIFGLLSISFNGKILWKLFSLLSTIAMLSTVDGNWVGAVEACLSKPIAANWQGAS